MHNDGCDSGASQVSRIHELAGKFSLQPTVFLAEYGHLIFKNPKGSCKFTGSYAPSGEAPT